MCIVSQAADGSLINDIVIKTKKPKGKTRQKTLKEGTLLPCRRAVSQRQTQPIVIGSQ